MKQSVQDGQIHRRLIESLYVESMLLADQARGYFDVIGRIERDLLDPLGRVAFSCESLKVTTRLMHVIAWLLTQRAVMAGELTEREALDPSRRLGEAPATDSQVLVDMPIDAAGLIAASIDLHRRVTRLDQAQARTAVTDSPARSLLDRLAAAF